MSTKFSKKTLVAFAGLLGVTAQAWAGGALSVSESVSVDAAPTAVWRVVGTFSGLVAWHPVVASSDVVKGEDNQKGAERKVVTQDGAVLMEQLVELSAEAHSMTYTILESPLPVVNYVSTLSLEPAGAGTKVTWSSTFDRDPAAEGVDDDAAKGAISGIYKAGFDGLTAILAEQK